MNPVTASKTTSNMPPPGPSLSTFGANPLYNAENLIITKHYTNNIMKLVTLLHEQ